MTTDGVPARDELAAARVDALYSTVPAPHAVHVESGAVAALLARAHHRVHGRAAGWFDGGELTVVGARTPTAPPEPDVLDALVQRLTAADRPAMLVGPGVVEAGAVPALHGFATAGSLGVLNTWGAKGVFDWRSAHHWATVGLQARDYELGGLAGADLVIASGTDVAESPPDAWQLAPFVDVAPEWLGALAERWRRPPNAPPMPPLRDALARVTQSRWADDAAPLAPTRVTRTYSSAIGAVGGLVAADAGVAGYWVARTFATTALRSAVVPADPQPGFAVARAIVSRLVQPFRPALAVVDGPVDPVVSALVDTAARLGAAVAVEVWDRSGDAIDGPAHEARLHAAVGADHSTVVTVATDRGQLDEMIAAAGPVTVWTGRVRA